MAIVFRVIVHNLTKPEVNLIAPNNMNDSIVINRHIRIHAVASKVGDVDGFGPLLLGGEGEGKDEEERKGEGAKEGKESEF
jgi:hypothetical protein